MTQHLLQELRGGPSTVAYANRAYRFQCAFIKTRDERDRNNVVVRLAVASQNQLQPQYATEAYLCVCWRSMTVLVCRRGCALSRDNTHTPQFHQGWRMADMFAMEATLGGYTGLANLDLRRARFVLRPDCALRAVGAVSNGVGGPPLRAASPTASGQFGGAPLTRPLAAEGLKLVCASGSGTPCFARIVPVGISAYFAD